MAVVLRLCWLVLGSSFSPPVPENSSDETRCEPALLYDCRASSPLPQHARSVNIRGVCGVRPLLSRRHMLESAQPTSNLGRVSGSSVDMGGTKLVLNTKTFSSADEHLRQQANQT